MPRIDLVLVHADACALEFPLIQMQLGLVVANWRHADERDNARRLLPSIQPYDELSDAERQMDRTTSAAARGE